MESRIMNRRDLDFLLYELLDVDALSSRVRHEDHGRDTIAAMLDTAEAMAETDFAPNNRKADENEPRFENGRVTQIPETGESLRRFSEAGFMAALGDERWGGIQMPFTVNMAINAVFSAANISTMAYAFLTQSAANMLETFGSGEQKERFLPRMLSGEFFGTMCLTEPQAGSSLSDIRTTAAPQADGSYRITGNKIYISGGEQAITSNIVHLVLARIKDAPPGVKGISLFLVPKVLVNDDGSLGERNDVSLAGLIHKMGYRGTTSTMLNFGEREGAVGWLIGEPHKGLSYMFQMMNEARVIVGNGAAALACTGYLHSLAYARERVQGRPAAAKDPTAPPVPIIKHPDVRRMLVAQKAYAEGALALTLFAARLVDEWRTGETEEARSGAHQLLELLTPVAKSWPSQWGLEANSLAIQVHGGYGYTREYPVEQIYRDNRLNPIHEGTHGIQALDLLGRKVRMDDGAAFERLCALMVETADAARAHPGLVEFSDALADTVERARLTTAALRANMTETVLGNASVYLEMLGHVVVAWLWLKQAVVACDALAADPHEADRAFYAGKLAACRYFFRWELPKTGPQLDRLAAVDDTWFAMAEDHF
ncbi:acyl-CoA dehydrogenase [Caenispirillum salinarum]|nr:acyl-CoA dehydrogenase [Caenispirillum salinarum]